MKRLSSRYNTTKRRLGETSRGLRLAVSLSAEGLAGGPLRSVPEGRHTEPTVGPDSRSPEGQAESPVVLSGFQPVGLPRWTWPDQPYVRLWPT